MGSKRRRDEGDRDLSDHHRHLFWRYVCRRVWNSGHLIGLLVMSGRNLRPGEDFIGEFNEASGGSVEARRDGRRWTVEEWHQYTNRNYAEASVLQSKCIRAMEDRAMLSDPGN